MKKSKWGMAVFLTTAFLCVAGSITASAEETEVTKGWKQEDNKWVYLKADGTKVTDTWIREPYGKFYYLDSDGYMAVNQFIEDGSDLYYADETGNRARCRWASASNAEREWDEEVDTIWYYFDKNGKAVKDEGKALNLNENGTARKYFFDSDGHMLSGWQEITNASNETNIYYLGDENQGYAHLLWQYLAPDEDMFQTDEHDDYDVYEMFYFGYDGKMTRSSESKLEGERFLFDANGVRVTGWQPGIVPTSSEQGINKYYDEKTGARAKGWLYAYDPEEGEGGEPHWYYCDKKTGLVYNEGGKDSGAAGGLAYKRIQGKTYFFDTRGHMLTGLISTDGTQISDTSFCDDGFERVEGDIGSSTRCLSAGIYYLSQNENSLGQLQTDGELKLTGGTDRLVYYMDKDGRAYTNALIDGKLYGTDGTRIQSDNGWDIVTVEEDIYKASDYSGADLKENAKPAITAGNSVIVNNSGKLKKNGKVKLDGVTYQVKNYVVTE